MESMVIWLKIWTRSPEDNADLLHLVTLHQGESKMVWETTCRAALRKMADQLTAKDADRLQRGLVVLEVGVDPFPEPNCQPYLLT